MLMSNYGLVRILMLRFVIPYASTKFNSYAMKLHPTCRGIVTSDVLVKGLSCGAIAARKLEGVNRDKGHEEFYTSSAPYGEGKAYV